MLSYYTTANILKEIKQEFQKEIRKTAQKDYGTLIYLNRARIRDIAIYFHEKEIDFINLAINPLEDKFLLTYEYYYKYIKGNKYIFIITEVDKKANEVDSIELVYPHAKYIENELSKRYGFKFLRFSEEIEEELFVLPTPLNANEKELNFLCSGIYNKIHDIHHYFHLRVEDENIEAVAEKTGWLYRGIVPLLNNQHYLNNLELTKRICTPGCFHHHLAYCMAIEELADIKIQSRVQLMRTLLCELDRINNHLHFFANLFFIFGQTRKYLNLLKSRLKLQKIFLKYFQSRFLEDFNYIGYTGDLSKKQVYLLKKDLLEFLPSLYGEISYEVGKSYIINKCQGIGYLPYENAKEAGVTGPNLRASGIAYDIRYEKPYLSYMDKDIAIQWEVPTFKEGDVYARVKTRLFEMKISNSLVFAVLKKMFDDIYSIEEIQLDSLKLPGNTRTAVQLESPRGELLYYVLTNKMPNKPNLGGVYIGTPSLKNFLAVNENILHNNNINDLALILHSLDLNFNEIDL
ncbi:MAG: hypothetical protein ACOC44_04940 [Promethearchaeia archaeon]